MPVHNSQRFLSSQALSGPMCYSPGRRFLTFKDLSLKITHNLPIRSRRVSPYGCFQKYGKTPKSSILIRFSIINHPFWGYHYFWKHPYPRGLVSYSPKNNRLDSPQRIPTSSPFEIDLFKIGCGSLSNKPVETIQ